jgi:hypothetical protein
MYNLKMFRFAVLAIVFLIFCSMCIVWTPPVGAVGAPTVTVALDQAEQTAQVAPGQKGVVTFTGTVHCTMPVETTVQKVLVSLEANAGGWPWSLTPSTMAFDRQISDATFSVSVRVPPRTSHVITQQLTISGKAVNRPGALQTQVFPATAMINIKQFYKFQLECTKPFLEISPGDQFSFQLKITNEGNDQDTIKISIDPSSDKRLDDKGWAVMLSQTEYIIDEGSDQVVKIAITPAQEWNVWKNEITTIKLKIYSFQALSLGEIPVESTYPLYVRERGWSTPGFEMYLGIFAFIGIAFLMAGISTRQVARARTRRKRR